jgi:hypothetical protein
MTYPLRDALTSHRSRLRPFFGVSAENFEPGSCPQNPENKTCWRNRRETETVIRHDRGIHRNSPT